MKINIGDRVSYHDDRSKRGVVTEVVRYPTWVVYTIRTDFGDIVYDSDEYIRREEKT